MHRPGRSPRPVFFRLRPETGFALHWLRKRKVIEVMVMEKQCSQCKLMFPEEELLEREDTSELVCEDCSGLQAEDDLTCRYDEQG
jgi:hypothetical protein